MTKPSDLEPFLQLAARITPHTPAESASPVQDAIRALLERKDAGLRGDERFRLLRAVTMSAIRDGSHAQALTAYRAVFDATRACPYIAPLSEAGTWLDALNLAAGNAIYQEMGRFSLQHFSRDHAVVGALERLARRSYTFEFNEGGVILEERTLRRICTRLDKLVRGLGGQGVVTQVIGEYARNATGRMLDGSFLYGRTVTQVPRQRLPSIPWHYLFQLGMKHLRRAPSTRDPEQDWRTVLELSRDLCAAFNVEPYSSFELLEIVPLGLQDALQDIVLYDEMFSFQQWQPKHAAELIEAWLSSMASLGFTVPGLAKGQWVALARSLLSSAQSDRFVTTSAEQQASDSVPATEVDRVLRLMTSVPERPNADYLTPLDAGKRNAPYAPLFRLGNDSYLVPPRAILARGLYEFLYKGLRDAAPPSPERAMGMSLEQLAVAAIGRTRHQGILSGAKYVDASSKKTLELDLLVETDERIFLIECKKKPLTNVARGGDSLRTMIDLSAALLEMALQLARHERNLVSRGQIEFVDGRVVPLGGRKIEKVAVTMLDHGSLQDRIFMGGLIRGLYGAQLATGSARHDTALAPVNKTLRALQDELAALAHAGHAGDIGKALHHFVMGTWWLGIDTLAYLCREYADLWSALKPLRHVTFRTGDIMTELHNVGRNRGSLPGDIPPTIGHIVVR